MAHHIGLGIGIITLPLFLRCSKLQLVKHQVASPYKWKSFHTTSEPLLPRFGMKMPTCDTDLFDFTNITLTLSFAARRALASGRLEALHVMVLLQWAWACGMASLPLSILLQFPSLSGRHAPFLNYPSRFSNSSSFTG
jgi:hypothetical protein